MKKCNACGTLNPDKNLFCTNCAASLEDAIHVQDKKGLGSNKKVLKFAGLGLLVVLLIFAGSQVLFAKSAGAQVMSGLFKMMSNETPQGHMEFSMETDDPTMDDILKDIKVSMDYENKKEDSAAKFELMIKDESVLEGVFALQDYVFYVDLLDLYDDNFYYSDKMIEDYVTQSYQLRAYLKDFSLKGIDLKKYVKVFEDAMGKDLYKEGGRVYLELDEKNVLEVMEALLEEAEKDQELAEVLHRELVDLLSKMIKDDFEFAEMDEDDWEVGLEKIEDFKDFEDIYEDGIAELLEEIEWTMDSSYSTEFDLLVSFDFDLMNTIKEMDIEIEVEKELTMNMHYKNKSAYGFKKFDHEEGIDIEDFMDNPDEIYEVSIEIIENLADRIQENETIVDYIEKSDFYKEMEDWYEIDSVEEMFELMLEEFFYYY